MSKKRKPKSNSLADIFFNNILFVKHYTFETPLPIYTVMERLHELSDEKHGWLNRKSRYSVASKDMVDYYELDIRAKDRRHQYTITHATGIVEFMEQDGTRIEGEIRFGVVYFFMLIVSVMWMFFVLQYFGLRFPLWLMGFMMITPTFTFIHMFYKRHQLINKMLSAITPRKNESILSAPKQRKTLHDTYDERDLPIDIVTDESFDYDQR